MPQVAPYGSWKSPIHARQIAQSSMRLSEVMLDGGRVYWLEMRPAEAGRYVVIRREADGSTIEMTPGGFNARTRVHEYGGGSYLPVGDSVYFTNFHDQRLYRSDGPASQPQLITPEIDLRYADFVWDAARLRLITVREDHRGSGEAVNTIASIDPATGRQSVLVEGKDFYSTPRLSGDGRKLCWLSWNHPAMPWDAAELWVADVNSDGSLGAAVHVAGGPDESVTQPQWSPDGTLYFVSDRTDWWNIYRWRGGAIEPLTQLEAELGDPQWVFRQSNYAFSSPRQIICSYDRDGISHLARLDTSSLELSEIPASHNTIASVSASSSHAAFVAGSPSRPAAVVLMDLADGSAGELRRTSELEIDPAYISVAEPVEYPTEGGLTAHGFFYPPKNPDYAAPAGEKPPLVVMVHGGPTSSTAASLRLGIQYYTSRGVAVLDVDYGGSSGYGRKYRQRLKDRWGIVDVDDCCNGVKYLTGLGLIDGRRAAITGGSAGGYTVLACLTFRDIFSAGASHFGVSDCEALALETHKFESRYLDGLIGPYPQRRDLYLARSPIHHAQGLSCPIIFFQGLEDRIVPPNQARLMADVLRRKHLPVALVEFEGEQHGFRKAENIQRALEAELYFFSRVFGFQPADHIEPVKIE